MTTYEKKLKRGKDGQIVRYIGKNEKGVKEKFRLGYDLAEAEKRLVLIQALWAELPKGQIIVSFIVTTTPEQIRDPRPCGMLQTGKSWV